MIKNYKKLLIEFSLVLLSIIFISGSKLLAQNDTIPPNVTLENYTNDKNDIYKLISDEALSYLKVELNKDLYVTLYKGFYSDTTEFGWHIMAQKDGGTFWFVDVFKDKNDFSLKYAGSEVKIILNKEETQFELEVSGPIAEQIKARKDFLVSVKDVAQNEISFNFADNSLLNMKQGVFNKNSFDHPLRAVNISTPYQGWAIDLKTSIGDKVKFCVYYHNSSDIVSKNTKLNLFFNNKEFKSITSSDNFKDYVSSLSTNKDIDFDPTAKWYHNYSNGEYKIEEVKLDFTGEGVAVSLGDVNPGYSPNDGYIVFTGIAK